MEELLSGNPHLEKESARSIADGAMMEAASICVGQMVGASAGSLQLLSGALLASQRGWEVSLLPRHLPVPQQLWLEVFFAGSISQGGVSS